MGYATKNTHRRVGMSLLILAVGSVVMVHMTAAIPLKPKKIVPPRYLSPIAMVADKAGQTLYIAEATAGRIKIFDVVTRQVIANIPLWMPVSGVAISPDDATLYVTAGQVKGKLCVIDIKTQKITARIPVGHTPVSPVVSPDGTKVYLANRFGRQADGASIGTISVVDLKIAKEIKTLKVPREPTALDISQDGKTLFVANHLPATASDQDYTASEVTIMDMTGKEADIHVKLPNGSTVLRELKISPDGKLAAVTFTLSRFHLPTTQLERGWMNTNAFCLIDVAEKKLINTILLDDVDHGTANPWAVAWSANSETLCVSHAGTREISVIEMRVLKAKLARTIVAKKERDVQNDLSFLVGMRWRRKLAGNGPRSMVVLGNKAYVGEYFSDSLSVVDITERPKPTTRPNDKPEELPLAEAIALGPKQAITPARHGEMLFNDASKMCFQMWQSCASCHPDARTSGLSWDLMSDGMGNPKNTKSMLLSHQTPPTTITGVRASAEISVRAEIRFIQFSVRPEKDAKAIDAYLKSIKPIPSPMLINGKLSDAALRGEKLFKTAKCASCHSGALFTDLKKYDVGTGKESEKKRAFDTPTLIETWRTAPYLYDGRAVTMLDVLSKKYNPDDKHGKTSNLTKQQLADLAEYILSL